MSEEHIDGKINEVYDMIEQGYYQEAIGRLKLLKIRFPDDILAEVKKWEQDHDSILEMRIKEIEESNDHPFDKKEKAGQQLIKLAEEYFKYYNQIRIEHEIV